LWDRARRFPNAGRPLETKAVVGSAAGPLALDGFAEDLQRLAVQEVLWFQPGAAVE
jgi:hypothetical protein